MQYTPHATLARLRAPEDDPTRRKRTPIECSTRKTAIGNSTHNAQMAGGVTPRRGLTEDRNRVLHAEGIAKAMRRERERRTTIRNATQNARDVDGQGYRAGVEVGAEGGTFRAFNAIASFSTPLCFR